LYDFDILRQSIHGTVATFSSIIGSGNVKVSPNVLLNFSAISRAYSTCCFWSFPTGTSCASYSNISHAISIGYEKTPTDISFAFHFATASLYACIRSIVPIFVIHPRIHQHSACAGMSA